MKKVKKCIICGKTFMANKNEKLCSDECRKIRNAINNRKYKEKVKQKVLEQQDLEYYKELQRQRLEEAKRKDANNCFLTIEDMQLLAREQRLSYGQLEGKRFLKKLKEQEEKERRMVWRGKFNEM